MIIRTSPDRPRDGFTLVELLAVIVIIGLLAAIASVAIGRARASARTAACISNWRQYDSAVKLFVADNRGRLPASAYRAGVPRTEQVWYQLAPYMVPDAERMTTSAQIAELTRIMRTKMACSDPDWGFAFNTFLSQKPLVAVSEPARTIYGIDLHGTGQWLDINVLNGNTAGKRAELTQAVPKPHNGRVNMLYLDGHVETRRVSEIMRADVTRDSASWTDRDDTTPIGLPAYDR